MALSLMIIDDDPLIGIVVQDRLAEQGLSITIHTDSKTALDAVKREKPGMILLDLCMPGIDGSTLCRMLKSDPETRAIRIVAISGSADESAKRDILERGAEAFIAKPFDDKFAPRISKMISHPPGAGKE